MRLIASAWIAAVSLCLLAASLNAARRPRYGGTLRIELSAAPSNLDPAQGAKDPEAPAIRDNLTEQVFETLVRLDEHGEPRPGLAASWTHDAGRRRWIFTPRPRVILHNGAAWEPAPGLLSVDDRRPIDAILRDLARPENAVAIHAADGSLQGTGPFRIAQWEAGKALTLEAHENYWGGRPYLDRVEVQLGRPVRDQSFDFEVGKADVVELELQDVRRAARSFVTAPVEVLALLFEAHDVPEERLRHALSLAVDRAAIQTVLLQKQGEVSAAILPQWLSGYSFVFPATRDLARARELAAAEPPLGFGYEHQNGLMRSIAERILLNAAEAGIQLRQSATPEVRLVTLRLRSLDPLQMLADAAVLLDSPLPTSSSLNDYETERALLDNFRLIPLVHIPVAYRLAAPVRNWNAKADRWQLANVWLDAP